MYFHFFQLLTAAQHGIVNSIMKIRISQTMSKNSINYNYHIDGTKIKIVTKVWVEPNSCIYYNDKVYNIASFFECKKKSFILYTYIMSFYSNLPADHLFYLEHNQTFTTKADKYYKIELQDTKIRLFFVDEQLYLSIEPEYLRNTEIIIDGQRILNEEGIEDLFNDIEIFLCNPGDLKDRIGDLTEKFNFDLIEQFNVNEYFDNKSKIGQKLRLTSDFNTLYCVIKFYYICELTTINEHKKKKIIAIPKNPVKNHNVLPRLIRKRGNLENKLNDIKSAINNYGSIENATDKINDEIDQEKNIRVDLDNKIKSIINLNNQLKEDIKNAQSEGGTLAELDSKRKILRKRYEELMFLEEIEKSNRICEIVLGVLSILIIAVSILIRIYYKKLK